jgi:hypothetical protein
VAELKENICKGKHMKKINSYLLFFLLLASVFAGVPFSFFGNNIVIAPANSTNTLGYELLDSGNVLQIWNHYDSYYFNVSNGMQFTNHYQEYWDKNVMMLGYYAGSTWNLLYRTDELTGFSKTIDLTETYCNATLWKDLTYAGYSFRLAIRYCLGVNDINLTVIPYIKNLGIDIPYQLAFGWEMKDIQVDGDIYNDYIKIDGTQYFLNQPLDNTYTALADSKFYLVDDTNSTMGGKTLYLDWDSSLDYLVQVKSRSGQYNAPVTLFVKIGTLAVGQEKYTKIYWLDTNEDLTTFTEVDAGGYFSETTTTCTFTNLPLCATNAIVYKDFGVGYFNGNYIFTFEGKITAGDSSGTAGIWMLSNTLSDLVNQEGLSRYSLVLERGGGGQNVVLKNKTSAKVYYGIALNTAYYFSILRNNTNVSCKIYSDAARTTLLTTLTLGTDASETFRYLFCGVAYDSIGDTSSNLISGYVKYLNITYLSPVTTLPATNVKSTNATLNGDATWTNTTWFQYGLTTAYGTNTTHQSITNGSFTQNIIGLTPGKLYHYRAVANNGSYTVHGNDSMFLTKPDAPTGITYTTFSPGVTNISWTKGTGSNRTVIVEKTGSVPTSYSDGTEIYNDTGTYYHYTTTSNDFIQMWGFTKWINGSVTFYQYSDNSSIYAVFVNCYDENTGSAIPNFSVFFTNPSGTGTYVHDSCNNPHVISVSNVPQGDDISLTVNATGYCIRTYIMDIVITSNYYINAYLPPATAPGNGTVNCELRPYIDSTTVTSYTVDAVITFTYQLEDMISIEIYNKTLYGGYGGWIFVASNKYTFTTSQVTIDKSALDNNTTMARANYYYNFCTGGIESALYNLRVISESNAPIENAFMEIKRYINTSGTFVTVSSLYTDANGYVNIYLVPNVHYKVFISKARYDTTIGDYILAPPNAFGQTEEKNFRLYKSATTNMWDYVTYVIGLEIFDHNTSFNVYFNISCPSGIMQWFNLTILYYNSTTNIWSTIWSYNETNSSTGGNLSFNINANGTYGVQCSFKLNGYEAYVFGVPGTGNKLIYTLMKWANAISNIDNTITKLAGRSPVFVGNVIVGYTALIVTSLLTLILFTFSPKFSGLGLIAAGMVVAWMKGPLNVISNATIGWNVVVIIIILGILVIAWTNMRETGGQT